LPAKSKRVPQLQDPLLDVLGPVEELFFHEKRRR
jgi:hypothetical protein